MKLRVLACLSVLGALCLAAYGAVLPVVVSYPAFDSGWSLVGNVTPEGCAGSCTYPVPDNLGNNSNHDRTQGSVREPQNNELLQVQANHTDSFVSKLVTLPSTQNYKVAVSVKGTVSGGVWPVMEITLNGTPLSICKYPIGVSITPTTDLLVQNAGKGDIRQVAETCGTSMPAGNNTIAVVIKGGIGKAGMLSLRNLIVYAGASGVQANVGCLGPGAIWHNQTISNTDLAGLNTSGRTFTNTNCGTTGVNSFVNLTGGTVGDTGCAGGVPCRMLELD